MAELSSLIKKILKMKEEMILYKGISLSEIHKFETENKIILPEEYKEWLLFSNGGELFVPGTVLFGIYNKNTEGKKENTLKYQNRRGIRREIFTIPRNYLIIGKLNFGDFLCMDLSEGRKVIEWDHENNEEYCYWDSFSEWLSETIEDFEE